MQRRRAAPLVFGIAALLAASCGVEQSAPVDTGPDASASSPTVATLAESPAAASRLAELHARFGLAPGALRVVTRRARVALPLLASDEVTLEDETSRISVRFALDNVRNTRIEVAGGMALYRGALEGADVVHRVHAEGTEDFVIFEQRPAREELSYAIDVSRVPGLRLVSNTLEFLDATGTPVLRVAPPYVVDSIGRRHDARLSLSGCGYDTSPAGPWGRKLTARGADRCAVRVAWGGGDIVYPAMVDPAWGATGSMVAARANHTATVLASGKILMAGGNTTVAELYDPAGNGGAGTFAATGSIGTLRSFHSASLLASGKVLVAGGLGTGSVRLASTELFDPGAGTFVASGAMITGRAFHSGSVLPSGKILVAGGSGSAGHLASAELFDPAGAGSFTATGAMGSARLRHSASVLPSGKVLVAGGNGNVSGTSFAFASAELFDPAGAGSFAATGTMASAREQHTATLLPSGKVLVAGGGGPGVWLATAEVYDPAGAGTFAATGSMSATRANHTASMLPSGKVLVAGGQGGFSLFFESAEQFDPSGNGGAGIFVAATPMAASRAAHTASVLASGKVLVAGGGNAGSASSTGAEVYGGAPGDACTGNTYCLSGFCVDGVCCNSACSGGACDRCDVPGRAGTCSPVPSPNLAANPPCAPPLACDGVNAVCPTSCSSDAACAPAFYCAPDKTCQARKAQAAACNVQTNCMEPGCRECQSGFCVEGFCCDGPCQGACETCAASRKQSPVGNGTCAPIKDGTDPRERCAPSAMLCGEDGFCNGTGACRVATPAGVACSPDGKACDGLGSCTLPPAATCDGDHTTTGANGKTEDCAPYKCTGDGKCRDTCVSVADCVAPSVCDETGKCVPAADSSSDGCAVTPRRTPDDRGGLGWIALGLAMFATLGRRTRPRNDDRQEKR